MLSDEMRRLTQEYRNRTAWPDNGHAVRVGGRP